MRLARLLLGGSVAFVLLAMAQEWRTFSAAWGGGDEPPPGLEEHEAKAAADTVHQLLTLLQHLYGSDGDRRFAERMPASEAVVEEMLADIEYLKRNQRRQLMELERLDVTSLQALPGKRVEIRTRERWQVGWVYVASGAPAEAPSALLSHGRFVLVEAETGWRVQSWEARDPAWDRVETP